MPVPVSRPWRLRATAVVAGIVLAAAATEAFLRVTHTGVWVPRRGEYGFSPIRHEGEDFWRFDPGFAPFHEWDGDPYGRLPPGARITYRINQDGLRGRSPPPGRPTVLVVGDSFTFGEGLEEEDTLVAQTERALAPRFSPSPALVNAGIPGYGTVEEASRLPQLLERFKPRAVLVVFVANDPIPLEDSFAQGRDLLRFDEDPPPLYLARLARNVLGRVQTDRAAEEWYLSYYFGAQRDHWEVARAALKQMKSDCAAAKAHFGVAIFPLLHRLDERPFAAIHEAVAAACREDGTPCIDLTAGLAREPEHALWIHPTDHHPDARACSLAAEALAPFVESLLR